MRLAIDRRELKQGEHKMQQRFSWLKGQFSLQVLLAMLLGALLGAVLAEQALWLKPVGSLFINAIKLLVAPLIFFALVSGIMSLQGQQQLGRLALATVALFLFTAMIASGLGILTGSVFSYLGAFTADLSLAQTEVAPKQIPPVADVLVGLMPSNFFAPFVSGQVLQIIVLALLSGIALNSAGPAVEPVRQFVLAANQFMFAMTQLVLRFTPIGVFALIAATVAHYGLSVLLPLASFIVAIYLACVVHMTLVYGGLVKLGAGLSLRSYFRAILPAQMVAFSTASSYGTLPVTYKVVTEKLGVAKSFASFVLPLGSTINMDGCGGIYPAIAAIFIAKLYGIELEALDYALIAITATVASLGTAGVPGTALVMLTVTLTVLGLPLEGIAFIAAVDRIVDMMRTTTNVSGDMAVAVVVAERAGLRQAAISLDDKRATADSVAEAAILNPTDQQSAATASPASDALEAANNNVVVNANRQSNPPVTNQLHHAADEAADAAFAKALAEGRDSCAIPSRSS